MYADKFTYPVLKVIIASLLLIFNINPLFAQGDWQLRSDKEGIRIYTSAVPDSKVKAIKVDAEFNADASQLVALIMDVNSSPAWVYHTKSAAIIKQVSPSELYYYSEVNLPWPATNRDFVAHLTVNQNPDTRVITIDGPAVSGMVPVKQGIVRIEHSVGKWVITPAGPDKIKVEYTIHVDPAGSLPSWLVNMFATEGPIKIFKGIRSQLQKTVYRNTQLAFVVN
ncbi:START domain-containing protein [Mucilaginibacter gotjawali]|uniref:Ribosome-associated toxin RatA of RatAB toxin-antitoxin module n=2 Tax=Mucilaginibacter gotjawali TaxID=1550579 RepID=A0A839SD66_9SPHI|nr:START domain-containing protein [Mucilaginibacter gotjawali]MBB3056141.1 ribosome-associated toxin RatA of RatAB toxin-antitoxin module [Mucilaginibacter gotjawali]BAU53519.1 START domain protein [Mucilaginibacter gotjawali]